MDAPPACQGEWRCPKAKAGFDHEVTELQKVGLPTRQVKKFFD